MTDEERKALVNEARLDAKAFRENTVYTADGDAIRLIANADRLDQYSDQIEADGQRIAELHGQLVRMTDRWEVQHQRIAELEEFARNVIRYAGNGGND